MLALWSLVYPWGKLQFVQVTVQHCQIPLSYKRNIPQTSWPPVFDKLACDLVSQTALYVSVQASVLSSKQTLMGFCKMVTNAVSAYIFRVQQICV